MKNIHLLPTDKPSKLYRTGAFILLDSKAMPHDTLETINQHIYITSDEEIKEGDWCYQVELNDNKVDKCHDVTLYHTWTNNGVDKTRKFKKIILTTDQDLINDGVQAIDDEFLEWFVKNPSCEKVETYSLGVQNQFTGESGHYKYEIIIPQEEPKSSCPKCRTTDFYNCHSVQCPMREEPKQTVQEYEQQGLEKYSHELKQKTLEEAAEKYLQEWRLVNNIHLSNLIHAERCKNDFIAGAKWQEERMYSEEEQLHLLNEYNEYLFSFIDKDEVGIGVEKEDVVKWFEQFKKN